MTSFFLKQTRTVGGISVLMRERRALCRIWRLNTGRSLQRNQQRPWLSNGREQTAKSGGLWTPFACCCCMMSFCPAEGRVWHERDICGWSRCGTTAETFKDPFQGVSKHKVETAPWVSWGTRKNYVRQGWWPVLQSQDLGGWVGLTSHQRQYGLWDPVSRREKWIAAVLFWVTGTMRTWWKLGALSTKNALPGWGRGDEHLYEGR